MFLFELLENISDIFTWSFLPNAWLTLKESTAYINTPQWDKALNQYGKISWSDAACFTRSWPEWLLFCLQVCGGLDMSQRHVTERMKLSRLKAHKHQVSSSHRLPAALLNTL